MSSLPNTYRRLKYIKTTGNQYTDIGYYPTNNTRVISEWQSPIVNEVLFGARGASSGYANRFDVFIDSSIRFRSDFYSTNQTSTTDQANLFGGKFTVDKNKNVTTIYDDKDSFTMTITNATFTSSVTMSIFALHTGTAYDTPIGSNLKCYSFKVYENDVLQMDLVPAMRKEDMVAGLYDLESGSFFISLSNNPFQAGPILYDESEISYASYLTSDGNQYIDTDVAPSINHKVTINNFKSISYTQWLEFFGVGDTDGGPTVWWFRWLNANTTLTFAIGQIQSSTSYINYQYTTYVNNTEIDKIELSKNGMYVNDILTTSVGSLSGTQTDSKYFYYIFSCNQKGSPWRSSNSQIGKVKIENGSELVAEFIPAASIDGFVGMYNTVDGYLYRNNGTGEFGWSNKRENYNYDVSVGVSPNNIGATIYTRGDTIEIPEDDIINYDGYYILDYIESDGSQYIDTKYIPQANDKIVVDTYLISNTTKSYEALYGSRLNTYQNNAWCFYQRFGSNNKFVYNRTGAETSLSNGIYDSRITITTQGQTASWTDGTATYSGNTTGTANNCVNTLYIFDTNKSSTAGGKTADGSNAQARIYNFLIYNSNDDLVVNLVPAERKSDGVLGLYEKLSRAFYTNSGSGSFKSGARTGEFVQGNWAFDYDNYYKLKYLGSAGEQYINTGYYANNNTRVVLSANNYNNNDGKVLFGARTANQNNGFYIYQMGPSSSPANVIRFAYANTNYHTSVMGSDVRGNPFRVDANKNVWSLTYGSSQTTVSNTFSSSTFTNICPLIIFGMNESGSIYGFSTYNLYNFKIYDNDDLVHNYIPAERKSDNEYGLYDTITRTFLTNQGNGTFISGGRIIPGFDYENYYRLNYIESSGTQYINPNLVQGDIAKIKTEFTPINVNSAWQSLVASEVSSSPYNGVGIRINNSNAFSFRYGSSSATITGPTVVNGTKYYIDYDGPAGTVYIDDTKYTASFDKSLSVNLPVHIFKNGSGDNQYCFARLDYMKIYDTTNTLIRYYIPAQRKSDGTLGLYDIANSTFVTNSGAGKFNSGGIMKEYAPGTEVEIITDCWDYALDRVEVDNQSDYLLLDYIATSTNNVVLNTGVKPTLNTSIKFGVYMTANTGKSVVGIFHSADNDDWRIFDYNNNIYGDVSTNRTNGSTWSLNTRYDFEFGNLYVKNVGATVNLLTGTTAAGALEDKEIYIFNTVGGAGRIYYLLIYENGTLIRNLRPAIRLLDNEVGMYDLVNNQFYTKSSEYSTGNFTYGHIIPISPDGNSTAVFNSHSFEITPYTDTNVVAYYKNIRINHCTIL